MTSLDQDPKKMYMRAFAYYKSGMKSKAATILCDIQRGFPDSTEAGMAQDLLDEIGDPRDMMEVRVVDLDISFTAMVGLMIKAVFAAIPAAFIVAIAWFVIGAFLTGIGLGLGARPW